MNGVDFLSLRVMVVKQVMFLKNIYGDKITDPLYIAYCVFDLNMLKEPCANSYIASLIYVFVVVQIFIH